MRTTEPAELGEAPGWRAAMLSSPGDPEAAQADLASVTALFPSKTVTPVSISGATFISAPAGANQSVSYGLVDDWLYLVSGDTQAVVDAASTGGLTDNPRFRALQSALGQDPTNGNVHGRFLLGVNGA